VEVRLLDAEIYKPVIKILKMAMWIQIRNLSKEIEVFASFRCQIVDILDYLPPFLRDLTVYYGWDLNPKLLNANS